MWGTLALCFALLLAVVYGPPFAEVLALVRPGPDGWLVVVVLGALPLLVGAGKALFRG